MEEHRPWALRCMAWCIVAWGCVWLVLLGMLAATGFGIRGPCGGWPPWEGRHTVAVVAAVVGVALSWRLRRSPKAEQTLCRGRPIGGVDAAIHAVPILASGVILYEGAMALISDFHCCAVVSREVVPWWASGHYLGAFALAVLVVLPATRR